VNRYGRMRCGVKQWWSSLCKYRYTGRAGTGPCGRERPPGTAIEGECD